MTTQPLTFPNRSAAPDGDPVAPTGPLSIQRLGLLAGEGNFPKLLARAARDRGIEVTAVGVRGTTDPDLATLVDHMLWVDFGKFGRVIELFKDAAIEHMMMAGRVQHKSIFQLTKLDRRGLKVLARTPTRRANDVLGAVVDEFAGEGIEVLDSTVLLRECMPAPGLLTPAAPADHEVLCDIQFAQPIADGVAGLDIGQTVVVKQQAIVAVEAMEGTDEAILRAGTIAGPGCVVVKVSKPRQDRRFDVPVLGLTTLRKMVETQCRALAFPGHEALFFDREAACTLAEEHGISIVAWAGAGSRRRAPQPAHS